MFGISWTKFCSISSLVHRNWLIIARIILFKKKFFKNTSRYSAGQGLISKLEHYGMKREAINLIRSYLYQRQPLVEFNGCLSAGASPGFGRGGPRILFFQICEAMRIARGVRGHAPPRNFLKRCNLVRFRVNFDQIFFFKKCHFLHKK